MTPFDRVRAQPHAVAVLERAALDERLASAYLFEGADGVGKERAAIALAEAVIAPNAPETARRITEGKHPDVRVFRPREDKGRNIRVEFLREEVLPFTQFAPFEARAAFVIFPEADVSFPMQHPEAANALLKTLEEPRRGVHFILLSARPDRLLPTIRSRCQRLSFKRLSPKVLDAILADAGVAPADRGPAIAISDGRADRALKLATHGLGRRIVELALEVDEVVAGNDPGALVNLANDLKGHDDLALALDTLSTFYRDVACLGLGLGKQSIAFRHSIEPVERRARSLTPGAASERVRMIREVQSLLERTANVELAMDSLLLRMRLAR